MNINTFKELEFYLTTESQFDLEGGYDFIGAINLIKVLIANKKEINTDVVIEFFHRNEKRILHSILKKISKIPLRKD